MNHQELIDKVDELIAKGDRLQAEVTRLSEDRIPRVDRSSRRRDQRLGGAFVLMAVTAVGLAGLGSASALDGTNTVFTDDIVSNAVTSTKIADGTIGGIDVRDGGITNVDIRDGSVGSADMLDGSVSSVDVRDGSLTGADIDLFNDNTCNLETILGTAIINADIAVPDTYNSDWLGWAHSCTGEPVQVRRLSAHEGSPGQYYVRFGANNPARLAMATINSPSVSLRDEGFITVINVGPGEFYVATVNNNRVGVDRDFSILAY
jgi:hypothetical protein